MATRPRPKARCPACGTVSIYSEHIGRRCVARLNGAGRPRCHGRFKAATAWDDWIACPACGTSGEHNGEPCAQCAGDGWHYFSQPAAPNLGPAPVRRSEPGSR
jgi:hypothetical protein